MRERSWATIVVLSAALTASCHRSPHVANQEYLKSGDAFVGQKKYAEAVIQYRNAVQQDPRSGEARRKLAAVSLIQGDLATSYREAIRAADLLPQNANAQLDAGQLLLLTRRYEDAEARADKALAIDPKMVTAQILKANALAGLRKVDDAVAEVEDAIRNDPARIAAYTSLGAMQYSAGQPGAGGGLVPKGRGDRSQVARRPPGSGELPLGRGPRGRRRGGVPGGARDRSEEPAGQSGSRGILRRGAPPDGG